MELRTVPRQDTMVVRVTKPAAELPATMGAAFGEVAGLMAQNGIEYAGPPFALYHNMDMEALDVEIGFPVADGAIAGGRVKVSEIPGGQVACAMHTGPYTDIERTYTALMGFIDERGLKGQDWMYECYLNSPDEVSEDMLKTEIFFPLDG